MYIKYFDYITKLLYLSGVFLSKVIGKLHCGLFNLYVTLELHLYMYFNIYINVFVVLFSFSMFYLYDLSDVVYCSPNTPSDDGSQVTVYFGASNSVMNDGSHELGGRALPVESGSRSVYEMDTSRYMPYRPGAYNINVYPPQPSEIPQPSQITEHSQIPRILQIGQHPEVPRDVSGSIHSNVGIQSNNIGNNPPYVTPHRPAYGESNGIHELASTNYTIASNVDPSANTGYAHDMSTLERDLGVVREIHNFDDLADFDSIASNHATLGSYEISIHSKGVLGKLKLGFKSLDTKIERVYLKYHDLSKRKFYWNIWEKNRGKYESYQDFKRNWDPKTNMWDEVKKAVKKDLRDEANEFLGINNTRRDIEHETRNTVQTELRREIEDLLRNRRPFS